ncbi:unnamed protein product [Haemonchus placei]|uniref:Ferritin n=1 Tax=Haemonchus placei TaxID=6290 RepID=A0A0N4W134_HAEPC|nr:unnamed protein product [Haemonchus placei]
MSSIDRPSATSANDRTSSPVSNIDAPTTYVDRASSPVNEFAEDYLKKLLEYEECLSIALARIYNLEGRLAECMQAAWRDEGFRRE